jgi:hypothetical protein
VKTNTLRNLPVASTVLGDYTRISDDASILVQRMDFPRALNVLQRRAPDHRRWRWAFRRVTAGVSTRLDQSRKRWMQSGLDELVSAVDDRWLKRELAIDYRTALGVDSELCALPRYSARDLWRIAELYGLPMEYLAHVTELPRFIDAPIDTSRVVIDCRRTAEAHRDEARRLLTGIAPTDCVPLADQLQRIAADAQRDAEARWRALGQRLAHGNNALL